VLVLALALTLGQVTVLPPGTPARSVTGLVDIIASDPPALVWNGQRFVIAWMDQRRSVGRSDVWVGTWLPGEPVVAAELLTPSPIDARGLALAAEGSVVGLVWGEGVTAVQTRFARVFWDGGSPGHLRPPDGFTAFPSTGAPRLALNEGEALVAVPTGPTATLVRFTPNARNVRDAGSVPASNSLALTPSDGGFLVTGCAPDGGSSLFTTRLARTGPARSSVTELDGGCLALVVAPRGASHVGLVQEGSSEQFNSTLLWVDLRDGELEWGRRSVATVSAMPAPMAIGSNGDEVVTGFTTTLTNYVSMTPSSQGPFLFVGTAPRAVVSDGGASFVALEKSVGVGPVTLRALETSPMLGLREVGPAVVLSAPRAQTFPSLVFAGLETGFLLTWDEADAVRARRAHLTTSGTLAAIGDVLPEVSLRSARSLSLARRGPQLVAVSPDFLVRVDPIRAQLTSEGDVVELEAPLRVADGLDAVLAWETRSFRYQRLPGGPAVDALEWNAPTCLAPVARQHVGLVFASDGGAAAFLRVDADGGLSVRSPGRIDAVPNGAACTVRVQGLLRFAVAFRSADGVAVVRLFDDAMDVGGLALGPALDPVQAAPLGDGVVVAYRTPDGGALSAYFLSAALRSPQPLTLSTDTAVGGFALASDDDTRMTAVAWEHFDVDAGAWVVRSRVLAFDAGLADAGVDAGADAGIVDAGVVDAGLVDAGPMDPRDGGPSMTPRLVFLANGCGCSSGAAFGWSLGLALLLMRRRRAAFSER
jgi:hypothetical protein